jgi:type 1 glutamine amidotransferase
MRTGLMAAAMSLGVAWLGAEQASAQQAAPQPGVCPAPAAGGGAGRGAAAGAPAAPAPKRVLAWSDTRNGISQHEFISYVLARMQVMGHDSKAYTVTVRTDSDIISFNPKMTDGKTPASGGPSLCNIDAIIYAGHRNVALDPQQKADLISALRDRGVGFVGLFIGILPNDDFPEMATILGAKTAAAGPADPWGGSPIINESLDSPFTKHLPQIWTPPAGQAYLVDFYNRNDIQVLLRKDLSKLEAKAQYTRKDGDYPVAWTKMYGKSRVFVSSLGRGEALWDDPGVLKMYDEAIRWAVGLTQYEVRPHPLPADVRPPQGVPAPTPAGRGGRGAAAE